MNKPLVSIIVPCYNQAQYLDEALQSVFDQTYPYWECIVINDGSTDNTEEIAENWIARDSRFIYWYQENRGLSSARNTGLNCSTGDYIQFLDADDFLHNFKIKESLDQVKQVNADLIISNYVSFTNDTTKTIPPRYKLQEYYFNFESVVFKWDFEFAIPIHCALFNAKYFKYFRFPTHLKAKEDWVMWIVVFSNNPTTSFINKPYAFYRDHINSMITDKLLMQSNHVKSLLYLRNVLEENDFDRLIEQVLENLYDKLNVAEFNFRKIKKSKTYKWGARLRDLVKVFNPMLLFKNNYKSKSL
jgi:glycosyltransferase involved in cell wall biosynthesis